MVSPSVGSIVLVPIPFSDLSQSKLRPAVVVANASRGDLHAASRKQINDTRRLKQQLMEALSTWIAEHHLKQAEAAEILMASRPRVSDVVNKKTAKFTIDTLVEMRSRIGKPVKLAADTRRQTVNSDWKRRRSSQNHPWQSVPGKSPFPRLAVIL